MLNAECTIEMVAPLFDSVKGLYLGSELAKQLAQMAADYNLLESLWKQISRSSPMTIEEEVLQCSKLKLACKITMKVKCAALDKIKEFFAEQQLIFNEIESDLKAAIEAQNTFKLEDVDAYTKRLKKLRVDFEDRE